MTKDEIKKEMIKAIGSYNNNLVDSIAESCTKVALKYLEQSRQAAVSGLLPLPSSQDIQDAADDAYPDLGECRRNEFGIDEFVLKRTAFVRGARYVIIKASGGNDR